MTRLIVASAMAVIALGAASCLRAEPAIVYLAQERSVEAEAYFHWRDLICEDDEGNEIECPIRIHREIQSASDFAPFDAMVSASGSGGGDGHGASSTLQQASSLFPERVVAVMSYSGSSTAGGPGSSAYSFGSEGTSALSVSFHLPSSSQVHLSLDLSAVIFGQYGEPWEDLAHVRFAHLAGGTVFDSRDSEPFDDRFNQQIDTTIVLPTGDYQIDAYMRGVAVNSGYFGIHGPGRMDMDLAVTFEAIGVPEPRNGTLIFAAAVAASIAWRTVRRDSNRRCALALN